MFSSAAELAGSVHKGLQFIANPVDPVKVLFSFGIIHKVLCYRIPFHRPSQFGGDVAQDTGGTGSLAGLHIGNGFFSCPYGFPAGSRESSEAAYLPRETSIQPSLPKNLIPRVFPSSHGLFDMVTPFS